jgi:hypothetical protein
MRYALLIYTPPQMGEPDPTELGAVMDAYNAFTKAAVDAGVMRGGEALEEANTATTVRVRGGKTLTTDGPYAETKEQFGGFYLIEAANLDEAIAWAARIPGAQLGAIEVRPIFEIPGGSPTDQATAGAAAG